MHARMHVLPCVRMQHCAAAVHAGAQVEFLRKAEYREYEIERDKRLASDVRLRGRL